MKKVTKEELKQERISALGQAAFWNRVDIEIKKEYPELHKAISYIEGDLFEIEEDYIIDRAARRAIKSYIKFLKAWK